MSWVETFTGISVRALEVVGAGLIVLSVLYSTVAAVLMLLRREDGGEVFRRYRRLLGQGILLGLEVLVAADIVNTVAIEPSFRGVGVLAAIILIRTLLSFTLEVEITGRWPWHGGSGERKGAPFGKEKRS